MSIPTFLRHHKPSRDETAFMQGIMSNPNKAKVWIAEVRATPTDERYDKLGKAMYYELAHKRRRSVMNQLRGAYNRARGNVEREMLETLL